MEGSSVQTNAVQPEAYTTKQHWFTLIGAWMAWIFDAMTAVIFSFVVTDLKTDFHASLSQVISIVSYFLIATAIGGIFFGNLGDKIGRKKALLISVAAYGIFNTLCGAASSLMEISIYRFCVGLAVGGLWSPAAALISETWDSKHRGRAVAFMQTGWAAGTLLAAYAALYLIPAVGWRHMFYFTSIAPLGTFLFVIFLVKESPIWLANRELRHEMHQSQGSFLDIFKGENLKPTLLGLLVSICGMFGWWILFTFLPSYLEAKLHITISDSAFFLVWTGLGALFGYLAFGYLCDMFGRRKVFCFFFVVMAIIVPVFAWATTMYGDKYLIPLCIIMGFFTGYFSGYGAWYSELFGTHIRSTAAGFCFNGGRAAIFIAPPLVAHYLIPHFGFNVAISSASVAYIIAAILVFTLKETKGVELSMED